MTTLLKDLVARRPPDIIVRATCQRQPLRNLSLNQHQCCLWQLLLNLTQILTVRVRTHYLYPEHATDLVIDCDAQGWRNTGETLRILAATGSFSFPQGPDGTLNCDDARHDCTSLAASSPADSALAATKKRVKGRKEATTTDLRMFAKQFKEAKAKEYQSWLENDVFELVDLRKVKARNFISGRWVLTIKRDREGKLEKAKARWVLRGFLDKQKG